MKRTPLYQIMTICSLTLMLLTPGATHAKSESVKINTNPYTQDPQLFQAENGVMGKYWAGNKKYPSKALIQDVEFKNIVVIKKDELLLKKNKQLRKNKEYLGFYIDPKTNIQYNLYGINTNPQPEDDGPDSDVLTVIAIKQDTGIGE